MRQGRIFLQIPGPSPVRTEFFARWTCRDRSPQRPVAELGRAVLEGSTRISDSGPVVISRHRAPVPGKLRSSPPVAGDKV